MGVRREEWVMGAQVGGSGEGEHSRVGVNRNTGGCFLGREKIEGLLV